MSSSVGQTQGSGAPQDINVTYDAASKNYQVAFGRKIYIASINDPQLLGKNVQEVANYVKEVLSQKEIFNEIQSDQAHSYTVHIPQSKGEQAAISGYDAKGTTISKKSFLFDESRLEKISKIYQKCISPLESNSISLSISPLQPNSSVMDKTNDTLGEATTSNNISKNLDAALATQVSKPSAKVSTLANTTPAPAQQVVQNQTNEKHSSAAISGKNNITSTSIAPVGEPPHGKMSRANIHLYMQDTISNYYAKPFPHIKDVITGKAKDGSPEYWKDLTFNQKKQLLIDNARGHDKASAEYASTPEELDNLLSMGAHRKDGSPVISKGLENDPKRDHGSDHAIRVGIYCAVYAHLYKKYDPNAQITEDEVLATQLVGAFHDSGRQADGIDIDDDRSAEITGNNLAQWGIDHTVVQRGEHAIRNKDEDPSKSKSVMAKALQCADSTEYARLGDFDKRYLDIYKEFNSGPRALSGKRLEEFNKELDMLTREMVSLTTTTHKPEKRQEFSKPGQNYYSSMLAEINSKEYPGLSTVLTGMKVI